MPNWCCNVVRFEAKPATIRNIKKLFNRLIKKEREQNAGQLPPFIKYQRGWFFNIRWEDGILYYLTRWAPNTDALVEIARRYHAGFTHEYEESGNLVFGKATYQNGELSDISLDSDDYYLFTYDEERNSYLFEGRYYDSDTEILEILLERKYPFT